MPQKYDCVVIGGGFFGCTLALFLGEYFEKIALLEQENALLQRASLNNQARVHMGYHYPRSLVSAFASMANFPRFVGDFKDAIKSDFLKFYGVAKSASKLNAKQFFELYKRLGAPIEIAHPSVKALFESRLIEEVFKVKEFAFDAVILREILEEKIAKSGIDLRLNSRVEKVERVESLGDFGADLSGISAKNSAQDSTKVSRLATILQNGEILESKFVFNATYAGINTILKNSNLPLLDLKHEVTEMALIAPPDELCGMSFTIMDGPFFSLMPYPSRNLYTLSHVRYTPHGEWMDADGYKNPYKTLESYAKDSHFTYAIKDAARFIPSLAKAEYRGSLFEIKTLQTKNERDDARPILFAKDYGLKGLSNIMGGKIDNIYEIISVLSEMKSFLGIRKRKLWNLFG